jgi:AraC family transcriptional regulator
MPQEVMARVIQQAHTADGVGVQLRWDPVGKMNLPGFQYALVCIHSGSPARLICQRDGKRFTGTSVHGDIDIIPAHTPMQWETLDGHDTTLVFSLPHTLLRSVANGLDLDASRVEIRNRFQIRDLELETLGWSVKRELELGCPSGRPYLDGLTLAMASRVVAKHSSVSHRIALRKNAHERSHRGFDGRTLKRVLSFIEEQLAEELPLAQIAAVAGVSPSHLKTLFRASTGLPVHQYVIQRRVDRAKGLLSRRDDMSMAEIAAAAGFAHQSHMARHMRRVLGKAPLAVRRLLTESTAA